MNNLSGGTNQYIFMIGIGWIHPESGEGVRSVSRADGDGRRAEPAPRQAPPSRARRRGGTWTAGPLHAWASTSEVGGLSAGACPTFPLKRTCMP